MLFSMLCLCPQHGISPYGKHMENWAKPGCFRSQDQRKSEIGVQLGIRGKPRNLLFLQR